jgi:glycine cleavage system H protein
MSPEYLEATIDKFILRVKKGLRYSADHVWVNRENLQYVVGLTDYAQRRGGDIVFLEFPSADGLVKAGEPVARYETIKAALEVTAPFDCEIVDCNRALEEQPELVKREACRPGERRGTAAPREVFYVDEGGGGERSRLKTRNGE